jgi:glycosyltransferase involved in cell wall biosynthesis
VRILLLAPHPFFQARGTPIAVRSVLEFLSGRGHHVDVLTYPEGQDLVIPNCRFYRVRTLPGVRNVRPGFSVKKVIYDFLLLTESLRMIRRRHYDAIHAVEEAAFIAAILRKVSAVPYVYDMDSSLPEQMVERFPGMRCVFGTLRALEGLAVRQSLGVLTVCSALEDVVRHHDPRKVVGRVEDTTLLAPSTANGRNTRSLPATRQGPVAMYVGNLEPYQGIDLLLHGFRHTLERVPNAQLVIVGGRPDDIEMYREEADRLGILPSAEFLGPRPLNLLPGLLQQAEVLVSPRVKGTNTPMKIYSYLDSGTPVLATRLRTHTQILDEGLAFLVEPDPASLGRGLARLFRDPPLRRELARNAKAFVQREFTPEAAQRKLEAFYSAIEARIAAQSA